MFRYKILPLIIGFAFINSYAYSQPAVVKQKIDAQITLAKSIIFSDMRRSSRVIDSVLVPIRYYKLELQEANLYNLKGIIFHFSGKQDSSILLFEKSESIGLKIGDKLTVAKAIQNKNMPYVKMGKYLLAIKYLLQAINYYESIDARGPIARCYGDIGNILIRQENPKDAVAYLQKAISIAEDVSDQPLNLICTIL